MIRGLKLGVGGIVSYFSGFGEGRLLEEWVIFEGTVAGFDWFVESPLRDEILFAEGAFHLIHDGYYMKFMMISKLRISFQLTLFNCPWGNQKITAQEDTESPFEYTNAWYHIDWFSSERIKMWFIHLKGKGDAGVLLGEIG